ncbi:permease prefix domain 1-containing protein [Enterococcus sp. LJL51]|uniref:permease prefix domain 1-containing protein n=1 Tax=Enterococcus sp. LJL51 TaxID=3416656 RepID=UPI003CF421DE
MKTIREYIESLFLGIEGTPQVLKLKEDLLAGAEDRYEDLKNQGKTENEAIGAVISEFGNIDELLEEMNLKKEYRDEIGHDVDEITIEEAETFLNVQKKGALFIGIGVALILIGSAIFFGISGWYGERVGEMFGIIFLFLGVAAGVPLFITAGTSMGNNRKELDDRLIPIQVKRLVEKKKKSFQRSYVFSISAGVVFCIISATPVVALSAYSDSDRYTMLGLGLTCLIVSAGVFLFIYAGVIMGSFTQLLKHKYFISDEDKLGPRAKEEKRKKKPYFWQIVERVYWPIVVIISLFEAFVVGNWTTFWIVYPVAGILFGILESIFTSKDKW